MYHYSLTLENILSSLVFIYDGIVPNILFLLPDALSLKLHFHFREVMYCVITNLHTVSTLIRIPRSSELSLKYQMSNVAFNLIKFFLSSLCIAETNARGH